MKIGNQEITEILVVDGEMNLIASITDENIISHKGSKVIVKQEENQWNE